MDKQITTTISKNGEVIIPQDITDALGLELKSTCIENVWLVITSTSDSTFSGEPLASDGSTYCLPEHQAAALGISSGDTVFLVFNEVLGLIILKKISDEV